PPALSRASDSPRAGQAVACASMPELPEVETTRRGVDPHVVGRRIVSLAMHEPRLRWRVPDSLPGEVSAARARFRHAAAAPRHVGKPARAAGGYATHHA